MKSTISLLDETPIYYTALALHPAYRWDYFEEQWDSHPDWVVKAKEMVKDVWVTDYKPLEVVRSPENRAHRQTAEDIPKCFRGAQAEGPSQVFKP